MPLLYYQTRLFLSLNTDVLLVEYEFNRAEFQSLPDSEREDWFYADATASLRTGLEQRAYTKITLVGKSLGTLALGHLLTSEPSLGEAKAIWLTPLLKNEKLQRQIAKTTQPSLFVIGTKDPHYETSSLEKLKARPHARVVTLEGADHSLEVEGNASHSIRLLERITRETEVFEVNKP
jgi:dienelactone hydrolase